MSVGQNGLETHICLFLYTLRLSSLATLYFIDIYKKYLLGRKGLFTERSQYLSAQLG